MQPCLLQNMFLLLMCFTKYILGDAYCCCLDYTVGVWTRKAPGLWLQYWMQRNGWIVVNPWNKLMCNGDELKSFLLHGKKKNHSGDTNYLTRWGFLQRGISCSSFNTTYRVLFYCHFKKQHISATQTNGINQGKEDSWKKKLHHT